MSAAELPPEVAERAGSDESLVIVNHEGLIVLMTPAAEKLFGLAADDIVGEYVEMLVPEKKRWGHQAYRRGYLAEPNPREMDPGLEPEAERPMDGTLVPIHVDLEPIRANGVLYVAAHIKEREA